MSFPHELDAARRVCIVMEINIPSLEALQRRTACLGRVVSEQTAVRYVPTTGKAEGRHRCVHNPERAKALASKSNTYIEKVCNLHQVIIASWQPHEGPS